MKLKDILKRVTVGDKLLIIFLVIATCATFPLISAQSKQGEWGIIEVNGKLFRKVPLAQEKEYLVKGYLYDSVFRVKNGSIEILDNSCPNPILHSGEISRTGEFKVCVHNRTVIRIEGVDSRGVDVVSR